MATKRCGRCNLNFEYNIGEQNNCMIIQLETKCPHCHNIEKVGF